MNGSAWLTIVGIGADGVEGVGAIARTRIAAASLVVGGARHLAMVADLARGDRMRWPSPIADVLPAILAHRPRPVVALASGDPFWFGVGPLLADAVPAAERSCLPTPSSASLAAARLGWALQDVAILSACGRPLAPLVALLHPGARILVLSADATTPAAIAALLVARGFGPTVMHVMEALGGPAERTRATRADLFALDAIDPLNLVAIDVRVGADARVIPLTSGLPDTAFEHDGMITKREVRAVTLSALAPRRGELLWDVGGGSGAVGIEWMLRHPANRAIGIEADAARADRMTANATALGVPTLGVVRGAAPAVLVGLPTPDAVFIGGGAGTAGVIDAAWAALRPEGRIVANAVTVETEAALAAARRRLGGTLIRVGIERLEPIGRMHAFRAALPVTQWSATKP